MSKNDNGDKQETPGKAGTSTKTGLFHERLTALLAALITGVTLWMLVRTFGAGAEPFTGAHAQQMKEAFERQKDVMQYGLALLGTVTGYYLGRVPAERRADSAQQASEKAQDTAKNAQKQVVDASEKAAAATEQTVQVKKQTREAIRDAKASVESAAASVPAQSEKSKTLGASGVSEGGSGTVQVQAALAKLDRLLASLD